MQSIKNEFLLHRFRYLGVFLLLVLAFVIRVYRVNEALGFYFDQGRDALVVWDLIAKGKFFLIGPTTGIAGIFRGPFYYYLITPAYWLGGGNPIAPAIFLAFLSVAALVGLYYLAQKAAGTTAGFFAVIIGGFSFYIILASRWLSNPTPMLLLSVLLLTCMYLIIEKRQWAWIAIGAISGISLFHFGSSGEFFYFPALLIFFFWQTRIFTKNRSLPSVPIIVLTILAFLLTAAPLILFDLRHEHILLNNIKSFLFERGSFKGNFWSVVHERFDFYYSVFGSKIFETRNTREIVLLLIPTAALLYRLPRILKSQYLKALFLLFLSPIVGLLFFQGNEGNIYDYYLTGYYLIFILIFAIALSFLARSVFGKVFIVFFFTIFLYSNLSITLSRLNDNGDGPNTIIFANQKQSLDWIYTDAKGESFNTDVYVPPVIPYAYEYLFAWYGETKTGRVASDNLALLYTLYEEDPPHPERLAVWKKRQDGIGTIIYEQKFGGITVQRRTRISK